MSYALACARPAVFRAVVAYSGAQLSGCASGTQPVAYFSIHGTRDSVLGVNLGRRIRDTFVRVNGCTAQNPPEPANGSLRHIITAYAGCRAATSPAGAGRRPSTSLPARPSSPAGTPATPRHPVA